MGPEAQCLTRALKAPTPHEPVTRLAEQARRSASRSRRPGGSGGCWRGSAGPRGGWSRPGGNGRGHCLSPRRGSADPSSGRRVAGQDGPVCRHEHAVKFRK